MDQFRISANIDVERLAATYAQVGWVQIPVFLRGQTARQLHDQLVARQDWHRVFFHQGKVMDSTRAAYEALPVEQRAKLDLAIYMVARDGFEFRYENIRVPLADAERTASSDPLAKFAQWMSQGYARDFLRKLTRDSAIDHADAQATAYAPGDFLTGHDDKIAGKDRRAAYVLGLTPRWRLEWGGLLLFHDRPDRVEAGLVPAFNVLNVFRVPHQHSVSEVSRAAGGRRYSITGWLHGASAAA